MNVMWTPQPLTSEAPAQPPQSTWSDAWLTADDQRAWRD